MTARDKLLVASALVVAGAGAIVLESAMQRGFSTRTAPTGVERAIATTLRRFAIPTRYRHMQNPVLSSPDALHEAEAHWADHCATCHANNGSGETMFGRTMYPPPPDMRLAATQSMSDGELYYTIKNGVRLSGMPAFGDLGDGDIESWKLVTFIRHLPQLTAAEEVQMEGLNPKTPDENQEDRQEEDFLKNGTLAQPQPTTGKAYSK